MNKQQSKTKKHMIVTLMYDVDIKVKDEDALIALEKKILETIKAIQGVTSAELADKVFEDEDEGDE